MIEPRLTATLDVYEAALWIFDSEQAIEDNKAIDGTTMEPWGEDEVDNDRADAELTRQGYRRVGDWVETGEMQWRCDVVHL
ncbi:hypothetical protein [Polymorphospora sp. NPDC050346]|uniref:hypothetical protein n=1 Tax=Polymorphospora sp. NPDC050346 TaxID=3155780 RepID=UPI0033FE4F5C